MKGSEEMVEPEEMSMIAPSLDILFYITSNSITCNETLIQWYLT